MIAKLIELKLQRHHLDYIVTSVILSSRSLGELNFEKMLKFFTEENDFDQIYDNLSQQGSQIQDYDQDEDFENEDRMGQEE